jgi:hypothetical protein
MVKNTLLRLRNKIKQRILNKILKNNNNTKKKLVKKQKKEELKAKVEPTPSMEVENTHQIFSSTNDERQESIKEHFFTFQLYNDLFTLLYSTLVFKWIQTDRVIIN